MADLLTSELIDMVTDSKTGTMPSTGENLLKSIEGNLSQLAKMNLSDLMKNGLTEKKAMKIMASIELGKRIAGYHEEERPKINGPYDIARLLMPEMKYLDKEVFKVLLLDTKNRVIKIETITIGILDASLIHPRECFKKAIENNASSIAISHCHPSGDPSPSSQDMEITKTLRDAGEILNISVIDHIIIGCGTGRYLSMKEKHLF